MPTIQEWLTNGTKKLMKAKIPSARLDCLVILEDTLKKSREWLLAHSDEAISNPKVDILNNILTQRLNHIPLAYITGRKEFYGRSFFVNSNVLIPRPESEDIIELLKSVIPAEAGIYNPDWVLFEPELPQSRWPDPRKAVHGARRVGNDNKLPSSHSPPPTIIDIGTGSGCLAITAKLELPGSKVIALDNSREALAVAKQNAKHLDADVEFKISDLLESVVISDKTVLLVNLPYVPKSFITSEEITKEPSSAIFSGVDGLDQYKRFWEQLAHSKACDFVVISESLLSQHGEMTNLAKESGFEIDRSHGLAQMFVSVYKSGA